MAKKKKGKGTQVVRKVNKQTGTVKNIERDKQRKALPPGWRKTAKGTRYYEARKNRSDLKGNV